MWEMVKKDYFIILQHMKHTYKIICTFLQKKQYSCIATVIMSIFINYISRVNEMRKFKFLFMQKAIER